MSEKLITNALQSLVENIEDTIKEYFDEKITKEHKREIIKSHIAIASLRIGSVIITVLETQKEENETKKHPGIRR